MVTESYVRNYIMTNSGILIHTVPSLGVGRRNGALIDVSSSPITEARIEWQHQWPSKYRLTTGICSRLGFFCF